MHPEIKHKEEMMQDNIDFGTMNIPRLFRKMFIPTLLGMVLAATITIADGIFVGRGIGSDALAAVNIVAPFFMLSTGIGLMFGVGASIVASIHLSQHKIKVACINITQALSVSLCLTLLLSAVVMAFRTDVAYLLGSSEALLPLVLEYMNWIVPFLAFNMLLSIGLFVIRLDGSPTFAMLCSAIPALINLVLDYVFVYPLDYGLAGAALASVISVVIGSIMILVYLLKYANVLHLYRPKFTRKSIRLTVRNIGYMVKLGFSAFLSEAAIACMLLVGNYVFIHYLGENGVAAYSVACYCFPIVFMINNAIAQSTQPIISYNYGIKQWKRVKQAFRLSVTYAVICGSIATLLTIALCTAVVALFLGDTGPAYTIAVHGIPWFSLGFIFFALNIVCIGYYQSIESFRPATIFTVLRGIVILSLNFTCLPLILGIKGIWLAVPFTELFTFVIIVLYYLKQGKKR